MPLTAGAFTHESADSVGNSSVVRPCPTTEVFLPYTKTGEFPIVVHTTLVHDAFASSTFPCGSRFLSGSNQQVVPMSLLHYSASSATQVAPRSMVSVDALIGCLVVDRNGLRVGELRDIMLDLATGRIAYGVIALSSRANGEQLIVVPWNAVYADQNTERLCINAHTDWIHRAPLVQAGLTPYHFVNEWGAFIHNYFGTRPYWESASQPQYS
jgi:sporulation protein YlmC with PRC-barrel domain